MTNTKTIGAWPFYDVFEMNFEGDVEGMLDFFSGESDFYPEFDDLCKHGVIEEFGWDEREDEKA